MNSAKPDSPGTMKCGHPLAARQVTVRTIEHVWDDGARRRVEVDTSLVTTCWACAVEEEIKRA